MATRRTALQRPRTAAAAVARGRARPAARCTGVETSTRPRTDCQCNPDCEEHHSCCPDFHEHCAHGHGHSHDQSPPAHGRQDAPARSGGHAGGAGQGPRGHHAGGAREAPPGIENPDANCRAFGCLQFF
ncbi:unnamed protein product [Prorocentrum cordatum]|uniref:SMB domain-containing protein n=1 Tax=Prorocentrum cordatum TaxID=2364126 RepID=A0ABN9VAL9_9DINO|nr:unnamed protein product [Polarella glacialis]